MFWKSKNIAFRSILKGDDKMEEKKPLTLVDCATLLGNMLMENYWRKLWSLLEENPDLKRNFTKFLLNPEKVIFYLGKTHWGVEYIGNANSKEISSEHTVEVKILDYSKEDNLLTDILGIDYSKQTGIVMPLKVRSIELESGPTDLRTNHLMRKDIFSSIDLTNLNNHRIALNKGDSGTVWEKINPMLPIFTLFQSDRPSLDGDSEVQDPMKVAIKEALEEVREQLEDIEKLVQEKAMNVATLTLEKLKEMDPLLANELTPSIPETPKWQNVFKLTLDGDDGIPVNKRGSGVRRLILLNFFRAAAEKKDNSTGRNIIYAIEEPETAQHPSNQIMLAEALLELSKKENTQVILTTHVPAFASLLPSDSLRLILNTEQGKSILSSNADESVLEKIAETLGVFASPINRGVKVAVFVEGPNDLSILKILSSIIARKNPQIVDLSNSDDVVIIPCGGDTLRGWVENQYLKQLNVPEIHIYDRDIVEEGNEPKYEKWCKKVRERNDGSVAYLTTKREIENYIHPDAIKAFYGLTELVFGPNDDVPNLVASLTRYGENNVKKKLNNHVAKSLTYEQIKEMDTENEIEGKWFSFISQCIKGIPVGTA